MSKKTRIILNVVLGLILIGCIVGLVFWSIHCWELNRNLFLKEYNAQMEKFGYYKSDIQLFDQYVEDFKYKLNLVGNILGWLAVVILILVNILWGLFNDFRDFRGE